jgi:hypothetical protein
MEYIVLAVPVVTTAFIFGVKKFSGLAMFANGAEALPFLRFSLALFSSLGIVGTSLLTGNQIDPDSVSSLIRLVLETLLSTYGSHWLYIALRSVFGS